MPLCRQSLHEIPTSGGYCSTCAHCSICGKQISAIELDWCYQRSINGKTEVTFEHPGCFSTADRESLANKTIEIPQHLFDKLNAARLLFEPSPDLSRSTNEKQAELFLVPWLVDMDYENLCLFLVRLESIASATMLAIGRSHKDIDLSLKERDTARFKESERERQKHSDPSPRTHANTEKRQLTKAEKSIEKFISMGFSRADAESFVAEAIAKGKARSQEDTK
jgi:hypothetical protein